VDRLTPLARREAGVAVYARAADGYARSATPPMTGNTTMLRVSRIHFPVTALGPKSSTDCATPSIFSSGPGATSASGLGLPAAFAAWR